MKCQYYHVAKLTIPDSLVCRLRRDAGSMPGHLPWGALKEKVNFPVSVDLDPAAKPGEFVLQMLFAEFTVLADKKINQLLEPSVCFTL